MSDGPYLTSAFICEQVIEGKDGVLSAIRMIDSVTLTSVPAGQPVVLEAGARLGPMLVAFTFLVTLKSGGFKGRGSVRIEIKTPAGRTVPGRTLEVDFFGEEKGQHLILRGAFPPEEQGVYWFDVYFEDRLLTRSPLAVRIVDDSPTKTTETARESQGDTQ